MKCASHRNGVERFCLVFYRYAEFLYIEARLYSRSEVSKNYRKMEVQIC